MDFYNFLSRADDEVLQDLLGSSVIRLLRLLDSSLTNPTYLRKVLLCLRSPADLLLNRVSRILLLDLLRPNEAKVLAQLLSVSVSENLFQELKQVSIRRNSSQEQALLDFFELYLPEREESVERPSIAFTEVSYALFSHQRNAARQVKLLLTHSNKRVLLHMPTGSGKTRTAMNIIADHLRAHEPTNIVWLAYSEELCEQAVDEFQKAWHFLGNRNVSVYCFWGNHEIEIDSIHDGLVVAGLSKVYSRVKSSIQFINRLGSRSSLVIIDEAHQAVAETYRLVLDSLVVPYKNTGLLGLTATPGRTWAEIEVDEKLSDFFDRKKVTLQIPGFDNPIDYLVSEGYLAKANYRSLLYESGLQLSEGDFHQISQSLDLPQSVLRRLEEDEQRNLRILVEIEELAHRHQRILVFAISVAHSKLLAAVLRARGLEADAITSETPSGERERLIENFKDDSSTPRILCNYGVLTTGFDAPRTSAAVIARPTKSLVLYSQMVGRAIRGVKAGGNESAEIVTVVDTALPGFGSVADAFNNWEDVWD